MSPPDESALAESSRSADQRRVEGERRAQQQQDVQTAQQQAHPSSSSPAAVSSDTRTHVVGELYDTERSYVESLQILVEKYMKPLKGLDSNKTLIEPSLVDTIFYTIPEILEHHEHFLGALQDRLSCDWDSSQVIGNVFTEAFTNQQIIDTYTAFINNWKNARLAIKLATQARPAFERFLEAMSREHRNKLTLDALLIMPVQRIPRYELLIKELIKHTPEEHPDHEPLREAQSEIHELALKIDRTEREMLHQEQLRDIESLIEGHIELQQPQREFLRYDLVTVLSSSSLTLAKKERVLFLFCDLLIMTSVKKKVSRRSNLQTAFANSCSDLSLLEGNRFKLLLRVPLDQLEVKVDSEKLVQVQQQQLLEQQHQLQAQRKRLLNEQRREIEADLSTISQLELLAGQLSVADPVPLSGHLDELAANLRERLLELDNREVQAINSSGASVDVTANQAQVPPLPQHSQAQLTQEACVTQSPITVSVPNYQKLQASNDISSQATRQTSHSSAGSNVSTSLVIPSPSNLLASSSQQSDSSAGDTSLEFVIVTARDPPVGTNPHPATAGDAHQSADQQWSSTDALGGGPSSSELLVVNFPSVERRQAFLHSFLEAKQSRLQLRQQQMRHQQLSEAKTFSSSVTLRLTRPISSAHADASAKRLSPMRISTVDGLSAAADERDDYSHQRHRNSSAPASKHQASSSPHSAQPTIVHQLSAPHSLGLHASVDHQQCSCPPASEHHHHHHHLLTHQPASQPTSVDSVCCSERHLRDSWSRQLDAPATRDVQLEPAIPPPATASQNLGAIIDSVPKFTATLPISFLNTYHQSLRLTCASVRSRQTVAGERGQVWFCLSNGYVSHVALLQLDKCGYDDSAADLPGGASLGKRKNQPFTIVPAVLCSGDLCKSQINCAAQVTWPAPRYRLKERRLKPKQRDEATKPIVEVAVKSASPPTDIEASTFRAAEFSARGHPGNLSRSAPSASSYGTELSRKVTSISSTQLTQDHRGRALDTSQHQRDRANQQSKMSPRTSIHQHHPHHVHSHSHHHVGHSHHHRRVTALNQRNAHQPNRQSHQQYTARHNTVPIGELRRALERQSRVGESRAGGRLLIAHTPASLPTGRCEVSAGRSSAPHTDAEFRSATPPPSTGSQSPHTGVGSLRKSFRSARLLRHQASIKTSAILAKLVGGAGRRGGAHVRNLTNNGSLTNGSDLDDNDTDTDSGLPKHGTRADAIGRHELTGRSSPALDGAMTNLTVPSSIKTIGHHASQCDLEHNVVSPLSSVSSLNSTNSSLIVNSACASSTGGSCNIPIAAWSSATSCIGNGCGGTIAIDPNTDDCRLRSRSATVPCRSACQRLSDLSDDQNNATKTETHEPKTNYKVSEILESKDNIVEATDSGGEVESRGHESNDLKSTLWLGCEDGGLLIVDCLSGHPVRSVDDFSTDSVDSPWTCDNRHKEVKFGAAICDIKTHEDRLIFVALSDGQLAVFSPADSGGSVIDAAEIQQSGLANPEVVRITTNELNATSKLCIVSGQYLWYSYGRNIYVIQIATLKIETTIMAPTNDISLQINMQSITIDNMELMANLHGVWISFRNSHLIQFYDVNSYRLLVEINLFDPVNKVLSLGDEILRQHKTACLRATSLTSYSDVDRNVLFVGTSAGIVLYVLISRRLQSASESDETQEIQSPVVGSEVPKIELSLQMASLRHGHCGQVGLMSIVNISSQLDEDENRGESSGDKQGESFLVSGGAGLDMYGPTDEHPSASSLDAEGDNLNYLVFWRL